MVRFVLPPFLLSLTQLFFTSKTVEAQNMVSLHDTCTNSVQCAGVAICVKDACQCPPEYGVFGSTCVYLDKEAQTALASNPTTENRFQGNGNHFSTPPVASPFNTFHQNPSPLPRPTSVGSSSSVQQTLQWPPPRSIVHANVPQSHQQFVGNALPSPSFTPQQASSFLSHLSSLNALPVNPVIDASAANPHQHHSYFNPDLNAAESSNSLLPPPPPAVLYAYPGSSCGTRHMCIGGSFCYRHRCECPTGYAVSGYTCVQQTASKPVDNALQNHLMPQLMHRLNQHYQQQPAPFVPSGQMARLFQRVDNSYASDAFPVNPPHSQHASVAEEARVECPHGETLMGNSCVPRSSLVKYPIGILCTEGIACPGVAVCVNSVCTCPGGYLWTNTGCVEAPEVLFRFKPIRDTASFKTNGKKLGKEKIF